jgi:ribosomal protein S12
VIVSRAGLFFLLDGPCFSCRGSHPTQPNGEVKRTVKTSSGRMVKCWIPKKLHFPSTSSHSMLVLDEGLEDK